MNIRLENVGTRFNRDWIFRGVDFVFDAMHPTVILGSNGSGKSTLLKLISGVASCSEGKISYKNDIGDIDTTSIYKYISFASPYLEVIEEFTLEELIAFYGRMKPYKNNLTPAEVLEISGLLSARNKEIKNFSSGMKQRVKLTMAIVSDTPILLLDEPSSNLDKTAVAWYKNLMQEHIKNRVVIVCSNYVAEEHFFCSEQIIMEKYKS